MFMLIFILILLLIMLFSYKIIKKLDNIWMSKMEIECGMFSMMNKTPNSFIYILFLILFLIFDLEIILFFFLIEKMLNFNFIIMLTLIIFSLIMEIFECSIKWND